jgi:hypothetical protein
MVPNAARGLQFHKRGDHIPLSAQLWGDSLQKLHWISVARGRHENISQALRNICR